MVSHREPLHVDTARASHWHPTGIHPTTNSHDTRRRQEHRHLRHHSVPINADFTRSSSSPSSSATPLDNPVSPVGLGLLSGMSGIGIAGSISRPPFPPPSTAPPSADPATTKTRQTTQAHGRPRTASAPRAVSVVSTSGKGRSANTTRRRRNTVATGVPSIPVPSQFAIDREARSVAYKGRDNDYYDDDYDDNEYDEDDDDYNASLSSSSRSAKDDDEESQLETPLSSMSSFSFFPSKPPARRSSLSSNFMAGAGAGAGKDGGPDLLDLSEHLTSRAGRSTSLGNGLSPISPNFLKRTGNVSDAAKQTGQQGDAYAPGNSTKPLNNDVRGQEAKKPAVKPKAPQLDYFQERILRGDFVD